jgi:hypothetical protein
MGTERYRWYVSLADTPYNWQDPTPMSTLHALLVFVGIPVLAMAVISLLVVAPSLAKGPRYRPGQPWDASPEQFGALPAASPDSARQLEAADAAPLREQATGVPTDRLASDDESSGGASVTW